MRPNKKELLKEHFFLLNYFFNISYFLSIYYSTIKKVTLFVTFCFSFFSSIFLTDNSYKNFFQNEYNTQFFDKFIVYHIDMPGQVKNSFDFVLKNGLKILRGFRFFLISQTHSRNSRKLIHVKT